MSRAEEQIRRFEARRPLAVRLAEAVSLAVIADPPLLRKARLDLVPTADPGTEADLWLSPLVQTRSPDGIVFAPETAEALRARLAEDPGRLKKAWETTEAVHRHLTPALRLEEEIAWLALASKEDPRAADRIEELLRSALAALVVGERRGLAHWAARALPKLPSGLRLTQAARMLEAGAHLRLRGDARPLRDDEKTPDWLSWVAPADLPRVPIAIRLFEGAVEIDARPNAEGRQLQLPQTDPLLVDLSWTAPGGKETKAVQVTFRKGEMQRVPVPVQDVRLRTVLGEVYDLRKTGTAPLGLRDWIIDFSEELERHRPFFGRDEELAEIRGMNTRLLAPYPWDTGRIILVTGALGTGKTAFLAQFVSPGTPHHFFRRGGDLEDVGRAERSLLAQTVRQFSTLAPTASHSGLYETLQAMPGLGLVTPETGPLLLVLDAIDEARSADGSTGGLLDFLAGVPNGVVVLASAVTKEGLGLPGPVIEIPLSDAEPALREYWRQHFRQSEESVETFTRLSAGSFGVAKILRSWLERTDGRGFFRATGREALATFREELENMVGREVRNLWLGILAAAYEPLPSSLLYAATGGEGFQRALSPLVSFHGTKSESVYALRQEILRDFVSARLVSTQFPRNVFLSSTVMDLRPYRDAVCSAIQSLEGYRCWRFEDFEVNPEALVEESRRRIEVCDIFVSLVGHRRGTTPFDSELSYTELEYAEAKKWGKPILLFMAADDVQLSENLVEPDAVRQRQLAFRESVTQERNIGFFRTPEELAAQVVAALYDHEDEEVGLVYLHRRLAEIASAAIFDDVSTGQARRYGLQHASAHWLAAREVEKAFRLVTGIDFLLARCKEFGAASAGRDLRFLLEESSPESTPDRLRSQVTALLEGLTQWASLIEGQPEALASLLYTHLRALGWEPGAVQDLLRFPSGIPLLRLAEPFAEEEGLRRRPPIRHRGEVTGCTFVNLDDPAVLSWSKDGTLRLWDIETGSLRALFTGHTAEITGCAILANRGPGAVVSASRDGSLRVWNTLDGTLTRTLWGHEGEVVGVLTLDASRLVSWSTDRTLRIWDLIEGEVMVLQGHEGAVTACVASPDGRSLISGSEDTTVRMWDLSSGALLRTCRGHLGLVTCLAMRPTGDFFVSCSEDRTLRIWGMGELIEHRALPAHSLGILGCAFSPDGKTLATCSHDRTLRIWSLTVIPSAGPIGSAPIAGYLLEPSAQVVATLTGHDAAVLSCAFFPEGDRLVSCSADRTVRIWDLKTRVAIEVFEEHKAPIRAVTVDGLPTRVFSVSDDRTVRVDQQELGKSEAVAVLVSTAQKRVLVGSSSGSLAIYDPQYSRKLNHTDAFGAVFGGVLAPGKSFAVIWAKSSVAETGDDAFYRINFFAGSEEITPIGAAGHISVCAVTPDGSELVVAAGRSLRTWNLWINQPMLTLEPHSKRISDVKILPDGRALSASWDGTLRLWQYKNGPTQYKTFTGHTDRVLACAITSDGLRAVSASADRTLRLWDLETGSTLAVLTGHTADVTGCAFTRDGRRIVSRSKDGRLGLWDGGSGSLVAFTQGHTDWVNAFTIAEEEGVVYSCSEDQTVRAWDLATGDARGVVYGVSAFRSLAAVPRGVYAGDEAGNLWVLEYGESALEMSQRGDRDIAGAR